MIKILISAVFNIVISNTERAEVQVLQNMA